MALKSYKPTTPSQRELVLVDRSHLYKGKPVKGLVEGKHSSGGRNNHGRVTVRWRGGGHKRAYRLIDFKRRKLDMTATVERLEYDPNRTAFIALIKYADGELSYILAPQRLAAGDTIVSAKSADVKPGAGGQLARSAGTYAQYVGREQGYAILRLNSGEQRLVHQGCFATVGAVSNPDHSNINIGKAGRNRWKGRMPSVRGVAMNPVDHPFGGGDGRTSGGRHPVSPWGKPTKGKKTRTNKRTNKFIARSRHARKG
jgi:large subunit ribosomal protein L2